MKPEIKLSNSTQKDGQKCGNPDCAYTNCNCGSNCTCKECK